MFLFERKRDQALYGSLSQCLQEPVVDQVKTRSQQQHPGFHREGQGHKYLSGHPLLSTTLTWRKLGWEWTGWGQKHALGSGMWVKLLRQKPAPNTTAFNTKIIYPVFLQIKLQAEV